MVRSRSENKQRFGPCGALQGDDPRQAIREVPPIQQSIEGAAPVQAPGKAAMMVPSQPSPAVMTQL